MTKAHDPHSLPHKATHTQLEVSVLMSSYNHADYIDAAIDSVLSQTQQNLELVILDDGSTDETPSKCMRWAQKDGRVRFHRQQNQGIGPTLNRLLDLAQGDVVALLASDDLAYPRRLSAQLAALRDDPSLAGVCACVDYIDGNGEKITGLGALFKTPYTALELPRRMLLGNVLCASTMTLRRQTAQQVGYFNVLLPLVQDYDYWLRILSRANLAVLPEPLGAYRLHGKNVSSQSRRDSAKQTLAVLEQRTPALIQRHPSLAQLYEALLSTMAALALQAGAFSATVEYLQAKRARFARRDADALLLLNVLVKSNRTSDVRSLMTELMGELTLYAPPVQQLITNFSVRLQQIS